MFSEVSGKPSVSEASSNLMDLHVKQNNEDAQRFNSSSANRCTQMVKKILSKNFLAIMYTTEINKLA